MTDHEETIQQAKGHRRNREKVHRSNGFAMIAKKREPPFRGFRASRRMTHPAGNGSLGNIESKHQELTMDPPGAPGWVLVHHPENQITSFFGNSLPAHHSPSFGDRTPKKCKPSRCQRTTVSGVTTVRACFQPDQTLRVRTQKSLSTTAICGRGCLRLSTASCCRRTRFSSNRLDRDRKARRMLPKRSRPREACTVGIADRL